VRPTPSDAGDEHAEADERTLPFPYAEKFDDWVADETAASEVRDDRRDAGPTHRRNRGTNPGRSADRQSLDALG
jgi:hypothetical protein